MANAKATVERIEFILEEKFTHCNIFYISNEPNTFWGGGWKTKTYPASTTVIDILNKEVINYLYWDNGRTLGGTEKSVNGIQQN